ncbi:MAG TPA: DnaJ domain-containing protein [Roseiflexaceae bacterium]|nr:DnaJ domain-containing protein [Roseiflexaceae bacterium]
MQDFENLDYYELLGVDRSASADEIKRAYRREISKYHPDRFVNGTPDEQEYAQLRSQYLTEAYTTLSDFTARSAYNRGQRPQRRQTARPWVAPTEAQPRDYQAELYEQARAHLSAGRTLQAIGVLRQLHQINPFYRDSAELLARAEAQMQPEPAPETGRRRIPPLVMGGLGAAGVLVVAALVWLVFPRLSSSTNAVQPPTSIAAGATAPPAASAPTDVPATAAPEPTAAPPEPTTPPATAAPATAVPATAVPATAVPATAVPTPAPTTVPPTAAPTAAPVLAGEGRVLVSDDFSSSGWAALSGNGWSVGYSEGRYRITAVAGAGPIWSYRSGVPADLSLSVDMQVRSGEGGVLLRFADSPTYLAVILNPGQGSYRIEQRSGAGVTVLSSGPSAAIQSSADAQNRLNARLSGGTLSVLINDQALASVDVSGAPVSNRFGLAAFGTGTASEVLFDNLSIRAIQ